MLLGLMLLASVGGPSTVDASKLTLSAPAAIVEIDTKKLEGDLYRLSWSPDGQQLYLQTVERDRAGTIKSAHHYLVALNGQAPSKVGQEPDWSTTYWAWKSTQTAPGLPTFKIELEESQKRVTSTSIPMGGDLAKGGSGTGGPVGAGNNADAMSAAMQSQLAHYYTLKLKGEVVGEFVNAAAIPGLTFGWGPQSTGLIAFANRDGRVVIMDDQGRKQEVPSSKSAVLPGWTDDGKRLAFLERTNKNKATLKIVEVTRPVQ